MASIHVRLDASPCSSLGLLDKDDFDDGTKATSPKIPFLSPHRSKRATPNRPTSPLARLEARKSLLSPSRSCTSPSSQRHLLSPSKESLDVSPSSSARRQSRSPWNLSLSPIPPVDDAKRHYSPKFSPRAPSPLSQSPAASKSPLRAELKSRIMQGFKPLPDDNAINLQTELKGKRRSVVLAQPYALSRLESIKRKKTEGKCTLTEMIESPSAQNNGAFSFDEEEKVALVEENVDAPTGGIKAKRRSIAQIANFSESRIKSAKAKEHKGMSLAQIIQSPTARANGEGQSHPVAKKLEKGSRRQSLKSIQAFAQSRIQSAQGKELSGMSLADIIQSPSAKQHGMRLVPEEDDDDDNQDL